MIALCDDRVLEQLVAYNTDVGFWNYFVLIPEFFLPCTLRLVELVHMNLPRVPHVELFRRAHVFSCVQVLAGWPKCAVAGVVEVFAQRNLLIERKLDFSPPVLLRGVVIFDSTISRLRIFLVQKLQVLARNRFFLGNGVRNSRDRVV